MGGGLDGNLPLATADAGLGTRASRRADALARSLGGRPTDRAAREFEALFATLLVKEMRKALPEGFFGSGADGDIYGGWFDEHLGAALARDDGLRLRSVVDQALARKAATRAYAAGAGPAPGPTGETDR